MLADFWHAIPEPLRDPVALAAPFFLLFIAVEGLAAYRLEDGRPEEERRGADGRAAPLPGGYSRPDALASVAMGAVSVVTMTLWKTLALVLYAVVFWLPLPLLGVPPALVFFGFSVSLVYQFFVHTEKVGTLARPIELVLNTPSHHRVHHGRDPEYLDRNYGGILIVWDRIFGSFQPELHRPTYGLTMPVDTHRIIRLGYVFGPPGWRPEVVVPSSTS